MLHVKHFTLSISQHACLQFKKSWINVKKKKKKPVGNDVKRGYFGFDGSLILSDSRFQLLNSPGSSSLNFSFHDMPNVLK